MRVPRRALLLLGCAALAALILWRPLLRPDESDSQGTGAARGSPTDLATLEGRRGGDGSQPTAVTNVGERARPPATPPPAAGSPEALLTAALTRKPIDWRSVARLVGGLRGPLPAEARRILLRQLREDSAHAAARALVASGDTTLLGDLLETLDDAELPPRGRLAVLQALAALPDDAEVEVVRELDARLTGELTRDAWILRAIGLRGGEAGTRAILAYLASSQNPAAIPPDAYRSLDVRRDAGAAAAVAEALQLPARPALRLAQLRLAARPGAGDLVAPIRALDEASESDSLRADALRTLAVIGTEEAMAHVLEAARDPGARGASARQALRAFQTGPAEVGALLLGALDEAGSHPQPAEMRARLLEALGTMRYRAAAPALAASVGDDEEGVRLAAIRGLGRLGAAAQGNVPLLRERYASGDETTRVAVAAALVLIGGADAQAFLDGLLADPKTPEEVRQVARNRLVTVRPR